MDFKQIAKLLKVTPLEAKKVDDKFLRLLAKELRPLAVKLGWIRRGR